jgi:hypothetical protein
MELAVYSEQGKAIPKWLLDVLKNTSYNGRVDVKDF